MSGPDVSLVALMLAAPFCGITGRDLVLHAVTMEAVGAQFSTPRRKTLDAPCGVRVKVLAGTGPVTVLPWPPRVADLEGGVTRCRACMEATGNPRPRRKR